MAPRSAMRSLMTGAALASLTTAALADGWNGLIVFGGRDLDSGQYVSYESVFSTSGTLIGDGRNRATNRVSDDEGGGIGEVMSQRVASELGLGPLHPSQPQTYKGVQTPPDGYNYASTFYSSAEIRDSITGTASTSGIVFGDSDGAEVHIPGRARPGFLSDETRRDDVWGALVMVGNASQDLRRTADIVSDLDGSIDLNGELDADGDRRGDLRGSFINLDPSSVAMTGGIAADNIVTGVAALTGADAGLVVVVNAYDIGAIPEVRSDGGLLTEAEAQLTERETEAEVSESRSRSAEIDAHTATLTADTSEFARAAAEEEYLAAYHDPEATSADVAALSQRLAAAVTTATSDAETAASRKEEAAEAREEANELALSPQEIALRPQLDAAIADPTLIARIRTDATDAYNARLVQRLRGVDGNIVLIDQRALFDAVIADPARFGLNANYNQADSCIGGNVLFPCNEIASTDGELLFGNGGELSETGHQLAADQITALVSAPAALSGIPAVGIAAARSIADVTRDQLSREQTWKAGVYPFIAAVGAGAQSSEAPGFRRHDSRQYSGVVGMKYVTPVGIAVGAAGSYQLLNSPGDESAVDYDGGGWFGTVFAGVNTGPVFGSVTATYGKLDYGDAARISRIGAARIRNTGDAEGTVGGVTAEAGLRLVKYDVVRAGPIANFSHWRSEVDGYAESGWQATAVRTGDIERTSTRAGIGAFMEAGNLVHGQGSLFRAKLLYGHEFEDGSETASVTPLGDNSVGSFSTTVRGVDDAPLEFGAEIVLGFRGVLTTFGYDGLYGDRSEHRFRVGASMPL